MSISWKRWVAELDISQFFAEFNPTPKQLERLKKLLARGAPVVPYGGQIIAAALAVAPGEMSRLTPSGYNLLKSCQRRTRAFRVCLRGGRGAFHNQTCEERFNLLLSLGLIAEATPRQKLKGYRTVKEMRSLLRARALSTKGKKDQLVDRIIEHLSSAELDTLVADVILFRTTEEGDQAIQSIEGLRSKMLTILPAAMRKMTASYLQFVDEAHSAPLSDVLYDDGEVRITEKDVKRAEGFSFAVISESSISKNETYELVLTVKAVRELVRNIETSGDGWLTISTSSESATNYIQASYLKDYYPRGQWYVDASGETSSLTKLGFVQMDDAPNPMKWVSSDEVTESILVTLKAAFGVKLRDVVWVNFEIRGR